MVVNCDDLQSVSNRLSKSCGCGKIILEFTLKIKQGGKEAEQKRILTELRHLCCSDLSSLSDVPISHPQSPYFDPMCRPIRGFYHDSVNQ